MFTSRAEFRLHLRIDNADERMTPMGRRVGRVTEERWNLLLRKRTQKERLSAALNQHRYGQWLKRPEGRVVEIASWIRECLGEEPVRGLLTTIETEAKYNGYIAQQERQIERLKEERSLYDQLLGLALRLASSSFQNLDRPTAVYLDGASTLIEEVVQASGISANTLKTLLRMVEEKQRLVRMLTEYLDGPGLTVVIGTEHSDPELRPFSLIAATYFDGRSNGTVGIIGPTRMRYSKAISAVDIAAIAVARLLRDVN